MKKVISMLLALTFCLTLFGCRNDGTKLPAISTGDSGVLGTDFQKNMNQSTSVDFPFLCETDDGYYFEYDAMVYFIDKESGKSTVLCGKPDCDHIYSETNMGCNAFINSQFLTYYNGKLYYNNGDLVNENGSWVRKGDRLYSMNVDGTSHDAVQNLEFMPKGNTSNFITNPIIHRGQVYFCYSGALYAAKLGSDIEDAVLIYGEQKADDGSHVVNGNELYYELWADGDLIYFMAKNMKQSNGTYKDTLLCYDTDSKETKQIWQVPDKKDVGTWDTTGVSVSQWYVSNGYIYFYLCGNDIWYTELATGKTNKLIDLDLKAGSTVFSDEYIVVMNKEYSGAVDLIGDGNVVSGGDTLYTYDYTGKLLKEISLKQIYKEHDGVAQCELLFCDDGKVYIHADATVAGMVGGSYNTSTVQEHYLYAADIESASLSEIWSEYKAY